MLLIGNDCITDDEARTQMAIWYEKWQEQIDTAPTVLPPPLLMKHFSYTSLSVFPSCAYHSIPTPYKPNTHCGIYNRIIIR